MSNETQRFEDLPIGREFLLWMCGRATWVRKIAEDRVIRVEGHAHPVIIVDKGTTIA